MYCEEMASQIKGPFPTSLWDQLIPQISETEPFIRHAIVGIGAFGNVAREAMKHSKMLLGSPAPTPETAYALEKYGKALQGIRQTIASGDRDIKKFLVACVLVFVFETLIAKPGSAVSSATRYVRLFFYEGTQSKAGVSSGRYIYAK